MTEQTQPTDAELLPCPFCEGRARMKTVASDWWKIVIDHAEGCVLSGHYDDAIVPQDDESKDWLIGRWNTRAKWGTPAGAGEPVAVVGTDAGGVHLYYEGKYLGPQPAKKTAMLLKDLPLGTQLFTTPQHTQAQAGAVPLTDEQRKDLLAASFCIAAVGDPTATIKPDDAERIIDLLHQLGGIKGADHG